MSGEVVFLLKMSVIECREIPLAMCGVGGTNGRSFRLKMSNNDRPIIALLYRLWNFPSLDKEGWRVAPGWFESGDSTNQIGALYGVMNLDNQEFFLTPYKRGNSDNMVSFMKYLQALQPDKKIIILWNKASDHGGQKIQTYLNQVNLGLEEKDWKVTCLLFASNAPGQNPIEDVGLQGKIFCEGIFMKMKLFTRLNGAFLIFSINKVFKFAKCGCYL